MDVLVPGALAQQLLMESTGLTCEDEEDDLDQAKGLKSIGNRWEINEKDMSQLISRSFLCQVGLPQQCEPELFFVNPRPVFTHTAPHRKAGLGNSLMHMIRGSICVLSLF